MSLRNSLLALAALALLAAAPASATPIGAAAFGASQVVEKFQRTPAVRDALLVMIEAYDKLGMQDLANDSRRVLALNDAKGTFATDATLPAEKTWGKQIWDYMELDQN